MAAEDTCPVCCLPADHVWPHCACAYEAPDYITPKRDTAEFDAPRSTSA